MAYIARITFYADIHQVEALRELAYRNGTTISGYVRNLVMADVRKHGRAFAAATGRSTPAALTHPSAGGDQGGGIAIDHDEPDGGRADA